MWGRLEKKEEVGGSGGRSKQGAEPGAPGVEGASLGLTIGGRLC